MTITDIRKTKQGRYALYIDGEFCFSVHSDTYCLTNLAAGLDISPDRLEELRREDEDRSCRDKALRLLSHAAHSRGMLMDKLTRFYEEETAERAADRMAELDLLDDLDFGLRFGTDLMRLRGWSLRRTEQELLRKRLDRDTVAQVMEELARRDEDGDAARILKLLRGRYRGRLGDRRGVENTVAALRRQGFSLPDIRAALEAAAGEDEDG